MIFSSNWAAEKLTKDHQRYSIRGDIVLEVKTVSIRYPLFLTGTSKLETSDLLNVCNSELDSDDRYHRDVQDDCAGSYIQWACYGISCILHRMHLSSF